MKTSSPLDGPADGMLCTTYLEPQPGWIQAASPKLCLISISAKQAMQRAGRAVSFALISPVGPSQRTACGKRPSALHASELQVSRHDLADQGGIIGKGQAGVLLMLNGNVAYIVANRGSVESGKRSSGGDSELEFDATCVALNDILKGNQNAGMKVQYYKTQDLRTEKRRLRYDSKEPGDLQIDASYYPYRVRQSLEDALRDGDGGCGRDNVLTRKQSKRSDARALERDRSPSPHFSSHVIDWTAQIASPKDSSTKSTWFLAYRRFFLSDSQFTMRRVSDL
ncbi:hypothetical protein E1301_Tti017263 [Triplophysa tibetana]|uniref:Uncharacterized protein n=1 Tax=Triplophysa tibetana TaxID=1572043 RepID=A0A5A9N4E4_9TELE|nr:hypothetical protein E1301_Tti017263 [Triplophysa tibetana]